ncbi:hypothetical protein FVE85_1754 [Porphyridium purpureum]|uniref:Uncharacterized protein n=1 Tax=Porphyridium purpureum TaxID=35688 RepID=A0A5J4YVR1_PORPP|nr:hypothetical protein FVE85_1754 [Porphyridium purpureum]|eukprot:POR2807..scf209_3
MFVVSTPLALGKSLYPRRQCEAPWGRHVASVAAKRARAQVIVKQQASENGKGSGSGEDEVQDADWLSLMLASEPWQVIDDDALLYSGTQNTIWRDFEMPALTRLRPSVGLVFLGGIASALALLVALRVIQTTLSLFLFGLILGSLSFI